MEKIGERLAEPPGTLRVLLHSLAWGSLKPLAGAEEAVIEEAARDHRRHHGPLAGLLGAGLPEGRPAWSAARASSP